MMLTRRDILKAVSVGFLIRPRALRARASQPSTPVNFDVPAGACDCHTHIFGDPRQFPLYAGRVYTPEQALPEEMSALHRTLRVQRVVIVTASVYGTDNSSTLFGIKARGRDARGVAVIADRTSEAELDALDQAGIRGIRLNFATGGTNNPDAARQRFRSAADRIKSRRWHVQVSTNLAMISALEEVILASPVPVVVDHFGRARAELGVQQPGFASLVELVKSGKAYVKVSAASSVSQRPDLSDLVPLAQALIRANPDRVLWGTDWPHPRPAPPPGGKATDVTPLESVDDGQQLNQLPIWAPDAAIRQKILVSNPAALYRFQNP
jgi:predicted TIM-barrel fold metal-dependent hydrolase